MQTLHSWDFAKHGLKNEGEHKKRFRYRLIKIP